MLINVQRYKVTKRVLQDEAFYTLHVSGDRLKEVGVCLFILEGLLTGCLVSYSSWFVEISMCLPFGGLVDSGR